MTKFCLWCKDAGAFVKATEDNGFCFDCAEELACLTYDATLEFGYGKAKAKANAQAAWKGW